MRCIDVNWYAQLAQAIVRGKKKQTMRHQLLRFLIVHANKWVY